MDFDYDYEKNGDLNLYGDKTWVRIPVDEVLDWSPDAHGPIPDGEGGAEWEHLDLDALAECLEQYGQAY